MHVPWGWIKQRPHFIAEQLSERYHVEVFFTQSFRKIQLVRNEIAGNVEVRRLLLLPYGRMKIISAINSFLVALQLRIKDYDYVWFTSPLLFKLLNKYIPATTKVIYDCMDDATEFQFAKTHPRFLTQLQTYEGRLLERSDTVFTSSEYLKKKLSASYQFSSNVTVINNAISLNNTERNTLLGESESLPFEIEERFKNARFRITYIGTISDWMDFELIIESVEKFQEITYFFIGPAEVKIPMHERIFHFGPIEHKYVSSVLQSSDVLVMPFKLNELVLSVNPVKLYEYIYANKPTISVKYNETLQFEDYVYLYKNKEEYFSILQRIIDNDFPCKKSDEENKRFAKMNSWEERIETIINKIESR